jgi:hypothetical protein
MNHSGKSNRRQPAIMVDVNHARARSSRSEALHPTTTLFLPAQLLEEKSASRRHPEFSRTRNEHLIFVASPSASQPLHRAARFSDEAIEPRRQARLNRNQRSHTSRHRGCRDESSFESSMAESVAPGIETGLQMRKSLLGCGDRRPDEREKSAFGNHRRT